MRILIVSALYPPDIAEPAPYVKELARRLAGDHTITVLAYNHIPEQVGGVHIVTVPKNAPLPIRLFRFFRALYTLVRDADVVYAQNGPSVELPFFFVSLLRRAKIILYLSDATALAHAEASVWYRMPLKLAASVSQHIVTPTGVTTHALKQTLTHTEIPHPHVKPEIHALLPYPHDALRAHATSWEEHLDALTKLFLQT